MEEYDYALLFASGLYLAYKGLVATTQTTTTSSTVAVVELLLMLVACAVLGFELINVSHSILG